MKTSLEKQIEKLKAEDLHKKTTAKKLNNITHLAYVLEWKNKTALIINADCKDTEEAKKVLTTYRPTNKKTVIGTATDKYYKVLKTPFNVKIENPAVTNSAQKHALHISYESGKYEVKIELPINLFKELVKTESRYITDSEYHYFIGSSHNQLRNIQVRAFTFINCLNDEVINWYGGDQTLCKVSIIEIIINQILNP